MSDEFDAYEKLNDLPTHQSMRRSGVQMHKGYDGFSRSDFPWKKIRRFLIDSVGKKFVRVSKQFVHTDWVPAEYRKVSKLAELVETKTFMERGRVVFYGSAWRGSAEHYVDKESGEVFYVDPRNGLLCHKPAMSKRERRAQYKQTETWCIVLRDYDQLLKLNGVWYHVVADRHDLNERMSQPHRMYGPRKPLLYDEATKCRTFNNFFDNTYLDYIITRPKIIKTQLNRETLLKYGL